MAYIIVVRLVRTGCVKWKPFRMALCIGAHQTEGNVLKGTPHFGILWGLQGFNTPYSLHGEPSRREFAHNYVRNVVRFAISTDVPQTESMYVRPS